MKIHVNASLMDTVVDDREKLKQRCFYGNKHIVRGRHITERKQMSCFTPSQI